MDNDIKKFMNSFINKDISPIILELSETYNLPYGHVLVDYHNILNELQKDLCARIVKENTSSNQQNKTFSLLKQATHFNLDILALPSKATSLLREQYDSNLVVEDFNSHNYYSDDTFDEHNLSSQETITAQEKHLPLYMKQLINFHGERD